MITIVLEEGGYFVNIKLSANCMYIGIVLLFNGNY